MKNTGNSTTKKKLGCAKLISTKFKKQLTNTNISESALNSILSVSILSMGDFGDEDILNIFGCVSPFSNLQDMYS